jgi:hypothetical protein
MSGLGALLGRSNGGDNPDNSDAMTSTSDAQANRTSPVAGPTTEQEARNESQAMPGATGQGPTTATEAAQRATEESFQAENDLGGENRGLSPDHNLVGREQGNGDREPKLIATSAPIQRFKIGRFQFERAVLNLYEDEDVADFRKLVGKLPPVDRNQIKIIDREAAEAMVRPIEPGATKQFDSSVGRQRERSATGEQVIGSDPLDAGVGGQGEQFAKVAQMDGNRPVDGTAPKQVVNEQNRGDVDQSNQD